ncbi:MAG: hypothetical protein K2Q25_09970 [Mycobacteriaceae bacterium]|nr:hypothetical protein [Mycobacteriaceae bacterium]
MPLRTLVAVAGQGWRIEECLKPPKAWLARTSTVFRRWHSWHRWTSLAMLAHAFLPVATAVERHTTPTPAGLTTLTVNEFRRPFDALPLTSTRTITRPVAWSRWR